jgi:hypothetical protein
MHALQMPALHFGSVGWKHLQSAEWFATSVLQVLFSLFV